MKRPIVFALMGLIASLFFGTIYAWPRVDHPTGVQALPASLPVRDTTGIDSAKLYDRLCDKCHGLNGTTYGPALTTLSNVSDAALTTLVLKGVPGTTMPPLSESLTPEQLAALTRYVKENVLPKSPADKRKLEIGPNAAQTQMALELVQVPNSDLIARATLRDAQGTPMTQAKVVFNNVSSLGGRVPLETVKTNEQGLAVYYYPVKPGESVRLEAAYEGEPGRQTSSAVATVPLPGSQSLAPLASGLTAPTPPWGLVVILALVLGSIWLTFGYVVSLLWQIAAAVSAPPGLGR